MISLFHGLKHDFIVFVFQPASPSHSCQLALLHFGSYYKNHSFLAQYIARSTRVTFIDRSMSAAVASKKRGRVEETSTENSRIKSNSKCSQLTTTATTATTTYQTRPCPNRQNMQLMFKAGKYFMIKVERGAVDRFREDEVRRMYGEVFLIECLKVHALKSLDYIRARGYQVPDHFTGIDMRY